LAGAAARPRPPGLWRRTALLLVASSVLYGGPASGHGEPAALAFWGDFGLALARCQREIGVASASCGQQAWRIRRDCRLLALGGGTCDVAADDDAVEAVRRQATDRIPPVCSATQIQQLRFVDVREAQQDVIRFCRDLENAAVSAVFRPVPADPTGLSSVERTCIAAAAQSATKLLHVSFRSREHLLDRIAQRAFSPARKRQMLDASSLEIAGRSAQLASEQANRCPAPAFAALYGVDVTTFLATIASRGDCLGGDSYAQAGVLCPLPQCGNGMREPGEDCDDANVEDGDACPATCGRG
jgi:cysteine-rich repeat protein